MGSSLAGSNLVHASSQFYKRVVPQIALFLRQCHCEYQTNNPAFQGRIVVYHLSGRRDSDEFGVRA